MKTILKITAFLLIFAVSFYSCTEKIKVEPETFPQNISFAEYSLKGTSNQWTNLNYDGKVVIIGSNQDLEKYIINSGGSLPAIDFSTNSLLLASGKANSGGVHDVTLNGLQKLSANGYELDIELSLSTTTFKPEWVIALTTNKLNAGSNVVLQTTSKPCNDCEEDEEDIDDEEDDGENEKSPLLDSVTYLLCNSDSYAQQNLASLQEYIKYTAINQTLQIEQGLIINCCSDSISVQVLSEENNIVVNVYDYGNQCNCPCSGLVNYDITNLQEKVTYFFTFKRNNFVRYTTSITFATDLNQTINL